MCAIFNELSFPVTVILEKNYVDRLYRDAYYSYFSNKHFDMPRNLSETCNVSRNV